MDRWLLVGLIGLVWLATMVLVGEVLEWALMVAGDD
jgi:hypothetical protein